MRKILKGLNRRFPSLQFLVNNLNDRAEGRYINYDVLLKIKCFLIFFFLQFIYKLRTVKAKNLKKNYSQTRHL